MFQVIDLGSDGRVVTREGPDLVVPPPAVVVRWVDLVEPDAVGDQPLDVDLASAATSPVIRAHDRGGPIVAWKEQGIEGRETLHVAAFAGISQWTLIGVEPVASSPTPNHLGAPALALYVPLRPDGETSSYCPGALCCPIPSGTPRRRLGITKGSLRPGSHNSRTCVFWAPARP